LQSNTPLAAWRSVAKAVFGDSLPVRSTRNDEKLGSMKRKLCCQGAANGSRSNDDDPHAPGGNYNTVDLRNQVFSILVLAV
jgi:hypothetical protein